jgi:hypothetical protein
MTHQRKSQHFDPAEIAKHDDPAKDRLFADRQQHDEADKNSEKTRLERDIDRHGHDPEQFQVHKGKENHPELGRD